MEAVVGTSPASRASPQDVKFMRVETSPSTPGAAIAQKDERDDPMNITDGGEGTHEASHGDPSGRETSGGDATPSDALQPGDAFRAALHAAMAIEDEGARVQQPDQHGGTSTVDLDLLRGSLPQAEEWWQQWVESRLRQEVAVLEDAIMGINLRLEEAENEVQESRREAWELRELVELLLAERDAAGGANDVGTHGTHQQRDGHNDVRTHVERRPEHVDLPLAATAYHPQVSSTSDRGPRVNASVPRTPSSRPPEGGVDTSSTPSDRNVFTIEDIRVELSPARSVLGDYFGGSVASNAAAGPVVTIGGAESPESVRVAAFGAGARHHHHDHRAASRPQMMVTGITPALAALQQGMKQPYFDGGERKWPAFGRDWQRYVAYMLLGAPEGAVGDIWKRDLLVTCLHQVLAKRYQAMVLARPSLSFGDLWRDLEKHYAIDDPHHWRAMWDGVELQHQGEVIRLKDWLFFQAEFEAAKSQVSDWTEQEELDLLLKKLPHGWRTRVLKSEAKEAKRKFAVKVTGSPIG